MRTFDFTISARGHKLHGATWQSVKAKYWLLRLKDHLMNNRRYRVVVHVSPTPRTGDFIPYNTEDSTQKGLIYHVRSFHDPADMHELYVLRSPKIDRSIIGWSS